MLLRLLLVRTPAFLEVCTRTLLCFYIVILLHYRPTDRAVVVIFVVGGFTPLELAEVNGVVRCAAAAASAAGGPDGVDTEVIVAGTTISTPDIVYHQIFGRPPLEQTYE